MPKGSPQILPPGGASCSRADESRRPPPATCFASRCISLHSTFGRQPATDRRPYPEERVVGSTAESGRAATGLPLPPALSGGNGHLPPSPSGADHACTRSPGRMLRRQPTCEACCRFRRSAQANQGGEVRHVSAVTTLLSVEHVTRTFATGGLLGRIHFAAIDDISFSLESARPEIFAIIGESGSGKTTLARMILNTLAPSQGIIRFLGEDISRFRGRRNRLRFIQKVQPIFHNPSEAFNPLKRVDR